MKAPEEPERSTDVCTAKDAQDALKTGRKAQALLIALTAWRRSRAPEIAAVVEHLSALCAADFEAPTSNTKVRFHEAWMRTAKSALSEAVVVTGWLAAKLSRMLPEEPGCPRTLSEFQVHHGAFLERLRELEARGPDPRISMALFTVLQKMPLPFFRRTYRHSSVLYVPAIELLIAQRDPRMPDKLRDLARSPTRKNSFDRRVQAKLASDAIAKMGAVEPKRPDDAEAWLSILPKRPKKGPGDVHTWMQAILEAPDDDTPRQVYADLLIEQDDPRGEFIALQLQAGAARSQKRAAKLLRTHKRAWLSEPLCQTLVRVEFKRGFLDSAALEHRGAAAAHTWRVARQAPALQTLRALYKGKADTELYLSFLKASQARCLECIEVTGPNVYRAVLELPARRRIRTLLLRTPLNGSRLTKLAEAPAFAQLQTLEYPLSARTLMPAIVALEGSPLLRRIERLRLFNKNASADAGLALLLRCESWPANLREVSARLMNAHLKVQRSASQTKVWMSAHQKTLLWITALPKKASHVYLHLTDSEHRAVDRAAFQRSFEEARPRVAVEFVDDFSL